MAFPGENLFIKGDETKRTHHLHIIHKNSIAWNNYLSFREYLREHKTARDEYSALKQDLAKKYENNREAYTNGKSEFIHKITTKAIN